MFSDFSSSISTALENINSIDVAIPVELKKTHIKLTNEPVLLTGNESFSSLDAINSVVEIIKKEIYHAKNRLLCLLWGKRHWKKSKGLRLGAEATGFGIFDLY